MKHTIRSLVATALFLAAAVPAARGQDVLFTFNGAAPIDRFGAAVASIGDLDGDGVADLAIGAPRSDEFVPDGGVVSLVSGATGVTIRKIAGAQLDFLGEVIAGVGDVDDDGVPDVLVGVPGSVMVTHGARLFSGATGALIVNVDGPGSDVDYARCVSAAGDTNLDGVPDFAIAAPKDSAGRVTVVSGASFGTIRVLNGNSPSARFGTAMDVIGDWIGDGYPDLFIGAPNGFTALGTGGEAQVVSGQNGAILMTYYGVNFTDHFGQAVASAGGVDDDGIVDLLVGAPADPTIATDVGYARLIRGIWSTTLHEWFGGPGDLLGTSVAMIGDLDADGHPDFFLGAPGRDQLATNAGGGLVVSGASGMTLYTMNGDATGDAFGKLAAPCGDVNGDAMPDWIVGIPDADPNGNLSGEARLFSRRCGTVQALGPGCAASTGLTPSLALSGCFAPGGKVRLQIGQGLPLAPAIVLIGTAPAAMPLPFGCTLYVSTPPLPIALALDATGALDATATIPPGTVIASFAAQTFVVDPASPRGYAATNGSKITTP